MVRDEPFAFAGVPSAQTISVDHHPILPARSAKQQTCRRSDPGEALGRAVPAGSALGYPAGGRYRYCPVPRLIPLLSLPDGS